MNDHGTVIEKVVLRINRKLQENDVLSEKKLKYLKQLRDLPIDVKLLRKSSIGKTVNTLRKNNDETGQLAKSLVTRWKNIANAQLVSSKTSTSSPTKKLCALEVTSTSTSSKLDYSDRQMMPEQFNTPTYKPSSSQDVNKSSSSKQKHLIEQKHSSKHSTEQRHSSKHLPEQKHSSKHLSEQKHSSKHLTEQKHSSKYSTNDLNGSPQQAGPSSRNDASDDEETFTKPKMSFGDMLNMPMVNVANKKKHKSSVPKILEVKTSKIVMPQLPDISLPSISSLDVPKTEYRPLRVPQSMKDKRKVNKEPADIIKRSSRGQMYSGKKNHNGVVTTLQQVCIRVLLENVESLFETGGVPYLILEPLLSRIPPSELERLEEYNQHLLEDTDKLWKVHCERDFRGHKPDTVESWREMFKRLCIEREERLRRLSSKITQSQAAKLPERSTKLAYVAGAPKPSAQMLRKQKRYGTGDNIGQKKQELIERMEKEREKEAEVSVPFSNVPRRDRCSGGRAPSSLSIGNHASIQHTKRSKEELGSSATLTPKKKAKKPMMMAALKLLGRQKGRASSQIIRK